MRKMRMIIAGLMVLLPFGAVQADIITVDFMTTLVRISGPDLDGLDGATFTIHAEFDDAGVYVALFGRPTINALTHNMTIASASVGSSNGTFSDPNGLTYFPTLFNSFETNVGQFLRGGPFSQIVMETGPGAVVPTFGDTISVQNFNTVDFDPRNFLMRATSGNTGYSWADSATLTVDAGITAVPEPGTLALLGIGLLGIGLTRKRPA